MDIRTAAEAVAPAARDLLPARRSRRCGGAFVPADGLDPVLQDSATIFTLSVVVALLPEPVRRRRSLSQGATP